jgi:signal transduction histidine kinase
LIPLKQSSQGLIIDVISTLKPHLPAITASWREKLFSFGMDERTLGTLERLTPGYGSDFIVERNFSKLFETLHYNSVRLAKLSTDTRLVARSLELYQELCEPWLLRLYGEDGLAQAQAALEMVRSATFVAFSGAYFDTKTYETQALLRVMESELRARELQPMLDKMLELTVGIFHADLGAVLLATSDGRRLKVASIHGIAMTEVSELELGVDEGIAGGIAMSGEPQLISDTELDPRVTSDLVRRSVKSIWGVPLKNDGRMLGTLLIGFKKTYEWFPTERDLLRAIADRSVSAIERVQMTDALRGREQKIAELSAHLLRAQEEERKRISRELHDDTGQSLMVIRLYLGMLENSLTARTAKAKVRETVAVVDRTIEGIRRIIAKLSPLVLQELGLTAAIRKEAKDLAKTTGIRVRVMVADEQDRFAPEAETAVYRAVQEALHNVAKHAQAKSVTIRLTKDNDLVKLSVQDDGVGISEKPHGSGQSFGLAGIKERVASLGGEVVVWSEHGEGTRLEISVPVKPLTSELVESA